MFELYQADPRFLWIERALALQDEQNRLFWDEARGGYFFYGKDAEALPARPKEIYDGATPSGNSVSALNLLRLARLTGRDEYAAMAETMFRSFSGNVDRYPAGHTYFLTALLFAAVPGKEVVVAANQDADQLREELKLLDLTFASDTVFLYRLPGEQYSGMEEIAPFIRDMVPKEEKPTFYVCRDFACQQPTIELAEVRKILLA